MQGRRRRGKGKDSGAGNRSLATHSPACASLPPAPSGARGSAVLPRARLRQGSGGGGGGGGRLGPSCLNKSYLQEKSFGLRSSLLGAVQLPFPFPLGSRSRGEKLERGPAVGARAAAPVSTPLALAAPHGWGNPAGPGPTHFCSKAAMRRESRMFSSGSQVLYLPGRVGETGAKGVSPQHPHTHTPYTPRTPPPGRAGGGALPHCTHLMAQPFHFTRYSMRP